MAENPIYAILSNSNLVDVMKTVLRKKKLNKFDLESELLSSQSKEEITRSVEHLVELGLIKKTGSSDWDDIYVTSEGLQIRKYLESR